MDDPGTIMGDPLEKLLRRSDELNEALLRQLDGAEFDPSSRGQSAFGMCSVSLEHAMRRDKEFPIPALAYGWKLVECR